MEKGLSFNDRWLPKMQDGGIQKLGYKRNSPFKNKKEIDINSNVITMDGVDIPLMLIPNNDEPIVAQPNSGEYNFKNSTEVKEVPLGKYRLGGKQCLECGGKVKYQKGGVYTLTVSDNFSGNKTTVNNAELQEQLDRTGTNAERDVNLLTKLTRKRLHQNIATNKQHTDLKETIQRGVKAVILNENEVENGARKSDEGLDDSWAMYLGLPQKYKTWEISPYSPANSKNPEQVYYRFNPNSKHGKHKDFNQQLVDRYFAGSYQEDPVKMAIEDARMRAEAYQEYVDNPRAAPSGKGASPDELKAISDYYNNIVKQSQQEADSLSTVFENNRAKYAQLDKQEKKKAYDTVFGKTQFKDKQYGELLHYTADRGKDEKGEYISYYDIYDFAGSNGTAGMGLIGKPFEIYDRIYFDPTTLKVINPDLKEDFIKIKPSFNKKQEGGTVKPNLQKVGNIEFDSNKVRKGKYNNLIVKDIKTNKDYGVVRNEDGSYDFWDPNKKTVQFYESLNPKNWGLNDRSEIGDFTTAYNLSKEQGNQEFYWKGNRYKVQDVDPSVLNAVETARQQMLERLDYKANNYDYAPTRRDSSYATVESMIRGIDMGEILDSIKNRNAIDYRNIIELKKDKVKAVRPIVTSMKGKEESEGWFRNKDNKMFIYGPDSLRALNTARHEYEHSHQDYFDSEYLGSQEQQKKMLDMVNNSNLFKNYYGQESFDYLSDPRELGARFANLSQYMKENNLNIDQAIDNLKKNRKYSKKSGIVAELRGYDSTDPNFDLHQLIDMYSDVNLLKDHYKNYETPNKSYFSQGGRVDSFVNKWLK